MAEIIRIRCGVVNCFLVRQGSAAILVDAANAGREDAIERALLAHGVPPKSLRMVFLTHGHPDHTGSAAYFRDYYHLPLAMHSADGQTRPMTGRGLLGRALSAFTRRGPALDSPLRADIALEGLEDLCAYSIDARVLPLPGHTRGSVGLLLPGGRLLAGDMYMNFAAPALAHIAEDFAVLRQTHERVQELALTTVYPGHGGAFRAEKLASF